MQRGQALIACANVVSAVHFEMLEKADDPFVRQVAKCEARHFAALIGGSELEEQTDRVAVAADRGRTQTLDGDQVVDEEGVEDWPQRLRFNHGCASSHAGCANASNRRFASPSKPGVIARYTAVEVGST